MTETVRIRKMAMPRQERYRTIRLGAAPVGPREADRRGPPAPTMGNTWALNTGIVTGVLCRL